ncbi:hypothetical protein HPP92_003028 [Vanilla planifolia]|uniref:Dof zinc finger protein n=1 Tax=Vanilla planifolia TaxID=51239 RepID=A0A835S2U7_VANPL|nr:hypothetical protein HPP92_003393 [Vanilla planifolia]KAG0502956.1 hypothetical protein HPP92_003028 [Vanilla planifolia]
MSSHGTDGGSSRPPSMAERARLAKIPQPEAALKCPRCDSTNTKFCYFNNYSLTQPRHFCKTCRRYWTRGGALRNVPVGGGCRRNKRNKSSSSKSTPTAAVPASTASTTTSAAQTGPFFPAPLPFLSGWHHIPEYGFPGGAQSDVADYSIGGGGSSNSLGLEQWRIPQIQHFPFLGGLESANSVASGLYSFDGEVVGGSFASGDVQNDSKPETGPGLITQMTAEKIEESDRLIHLPRQFLGLPRNDRQLWSEGGNNGSAGGGHGSGGWMSSTHLSGFTSSTGNLL